MLIIPDIPIYNDLLIYFSINPCASALMLLIHFLFGMFFCFQLAVNITASSNFTSV